MSSEIVPPSPGTTRRDDPPANPLDPKAADSGKTPPTDPLPTGPGTASADDLGMSLDKVSPDPMLGAFAPADTGATGHASTVAATGDRPLEGLDLDVPPSARPAAVDDQATGVSEVVAALDLGPSAAATPRKPSSAGQPVSSSDRFPALDLSAPPTSKTETSSARKNNRAEDEEDEDLPPHGSSWPMALLASYASAVTIGLIWVLWGHRAPRERVEADPFPPADNAPDPGYRAGRSHRLVAPPPLPVDRIVDLGQTVRLGSLEVTPLGIEAGPVILRREVKLAQVRQAGEGALILAIRLKNVAADSILVPLDEAFLRERGRGIHDSFIETGPARRIEMFPLAVVSEWSIVGQEFQELGPGESYETQVVTAPDAIAHLAPEMTWRLRLRTDINQTETLGVRFHEADIRHAEEPDDQERKVRKRRVKAGLRSGL